MASPNVAAANQRLQADPRFQQAWARYNQTMAAAQRPSTTTQARNDDEMPGGSGPQTAAQLAARRQFADTIKPIVASYGLPGQPQAWLVNGAGQLTYQEDHSLRNNMLMLGGIAALGGASALFGGAAPLASTQIGTGAIGPITGGTGLAGAGGGGAVGGAVGGGGGIFGTAGTLATSNIAPSFASAIPASAGGPMVSTIAPGLAPLSAGSMVPAELASTQLTGLATSIPASGALPPAGLSHGMMGVTGATTTGTNWLDLAQDIYGVANDWENSRQEARNDASLAAYRQNIANEARFRSLLESRKLALDAPQRRADNSLRGDRLANTQDFHMSVPGIPDSTVTGGFRPSMWSENTRQLGRQMSADALAGSGTDELQPDPLERAPEPNMLDTALNVASLTSAIPYRRNRRRYQAPGAPIEE